MITSPDATRWFIEQDDKDDAATVAAINDAAGSMTEGHRHLTEAIDDLLGEDMAVSIFTEVSNGNNQYEKDHSTQDPSGPGNCYQNAAEHVVNSNNKNLRLVHGRPRLTKDALDSKGNVIPRGSRFGHAWVEDGDTVIDPSQNPKKPVTMPKDRYYAIGNIDPAHNRSFDRAAMYKQMVKHRHYGPWGENAKDPDPNVWGPGRDEKGFPKKRK